MPNDGHVSKMETKELYFVCDVEYRNKDYALTDESMLYPDMERSSSGDIDLPDCLSVTTARSYFWGSVFLTSELMSIYDYFDIPSTFTFCQRCTSITGYRFFIYCEYLLCLCSLY